LPPWWSTGSALTIPGIRGQPLYLLIYVVLIAFFVFFYTPVVFIPHRPPTICASTVD
jgi:preprotein translocase subunit SecY